MIALFMTLHSAHAAPAHSVALDIGHMDSPDRAFDVLGNYALATYGVRWVYDLERWTWLDLTGGLRFSERRSDNYFQDDGTDIPDGQGFEARWFHNTTAVGLRTQGELRSPVFQPYARAQLSLETGVLRLDEDPDDKDNLNELRTIALAPGVELVGGLDVVTSPFGMDGGRDISPLFYLEMGWNRTGLLDLGDTGELRYGGFVVRTGLGVAF